MCKKEVTSAWNPSNWKFLREKIKSSLKFKTKNWNLGREEWNNNCCKSVLLCKSELFINQCGKKNIIRELYYRGEEKHGEKRDERQIEREKDLWKEGKSELVTMRVWEQRREKVKGVEKKWESLLSERECAKKLCFLRLQMNIIFIGDATHEREVVFQKKKFGKQPIENKFYFY